jgi:hypothetical protein
MTNTSRFIPSGFTQYTPDLPGYNSDLFACYVDLAKNAAIFYTGKRKDHTWFFRFPNVDSMKKKINETISNIMSWEDRKAVRKAERKNATAGVTVGQIYAYSWGWEQTNVDFFQVIAVKGKTFTIREIRGRQTDRSTGNSMAGYVSPVRDAFLSNSEPIIKRSFSMDHGSLDLTTDDAQHYMSWYA